MHTIKKIITNFVIAPLTLYTAYQEVDAYKISRTTSSFSVAAKQFNFNTNEEQEAFLNILYLAGYLKPEQVWQDLSRMGKSEDAKKLFPNLKYVLIKAGAHQDDPAKFNPAYLRKAWLRGLDVEDAKDLMLYEAQHAFNRKASQERNEIKEQNWMNKYRDLYLSSAKDMGLIDRIEPKHQQYDAAWIAGASRVGVLARLIDFKYISDHKKIKLKDDIYILAGERELWAEIDGITPEVYQKLIIAQGTNIDYLDVSVKTGDNSARNVEGMGYLSELAQKLNIVRCR
jgi:hypothetical protein